MIQRPESKLSAASADVNLLGRRRERPRRWLRRNAWAPLGAAVIMLVLVATTQVVLAVGSHKDNLRQGQIALAAAGQTEFGVVNAPVGLISGQTPGPDEYTLSATLRATLTDQMAKLTKFWPTPLARQTSADAHSLTTKTIALMDLIRQRRLRDAGALYRSSITPLSNAFSTALGQAQTRLAADTHDADARAGIAALGVAAAAGVLLVLLFLSIAVVRRRLDRADIEERVLSALATTDSLTGAPNHRALMLAIRTEVERSRRYRQPFALMFLDIDHFKQVNDVHGHAAGDMTLATFARIVAETLRSSDSFGRWGGEEFLAVLPEVDRSAAIESAERIRIAIAKHPFAAIGGGHLTCSIGLAICPEHETEFTSLITAADRAMYSAKARGRNQVAVASDPLSAEDELDWAPPAPVVPAIARVHQ